MSATNRGERGGEGRDYFPTPRWPVDRLLDRVALPDGRWFEPAVGDGAIVRAVDTWRELHGFEPVVWTTSDLVIEPPDCDTTEHIAGLDFAWMGCPELVGREWDLVITNPPYNLALAFAMEAILHAPIVAFLLRLNWLATETRAPWLREHLPAVYVLPNRPRFDPESDGTDATEYAWFVWGLGHHEVDILDSTPLAIRRAQEAGECASCRRLDPMTLAWQLCDCRNQKQRSRVVDGQLPLL